MKIRLMVVSDNQVFIGLVAQILNNHMEYEYINILEPYNSDIICDFKPQLSIVNVSKPLENYPDLKMLIDLLKGKSKLYFMCSDESNGVLEQKGLETMNRQVAHEFLSHCNYGLNDHATFISNLINYNLSKRETDVALLITKGYSYKDIASELDLSIDTVRTHIKNIYSKLKVSCKNKAIFKILGYPMD